MLLKLSRRFLGAQWHSNTRWRCIRQVGWRIERHSGATSWGTVVRTFDARAGDGSILVQTSLKLRGQPDRIQLHLICGPLTSAIDPQVVKVYDVEAKSKRITPLSGDRFIAQADGDGVGQFVYSYASLMRHLVQDGALLAGAQVPVGFPLWFDKDQPKAGFSGGSRGQCMVELANGRLVIGEKTQLHLVTIRTTPRNAHVHILDTLGVTPDEAAADLADGDRKAMRFRNIRQMVAMEDGGLLIDDDGYLRQLYDTTMHPHATFLERVELDVVHSRKVASNRSAEATAAAAAAGSGAASGAARPRDRPRFLHTSRAPNGTVRPPQMEQANGGAAAAAARGSITPPAEGKKDDTPLEDRVQAAFLQLNANLGRSMLPSTMMHANDCACFARGVACIGLDGCQCSSLRLAICRRECKCSGRCDNSGRIMADVYRGIRSCELVLDRQLQTDATGDKEEDDTPVSSSRDRQRRSSRAVAPPAGQAVAASSAAAAPANNKRPRAVTPKKKKKPAEPDTDVDGDVDMAAAPAVSALVSAAEDCSSVASKKRKVLPSEAQASTMRLASATHHEVIELDDDEEEDAPKKAVKVSLPPSPPTYPTPTFRPSEPPAAAAASAAAASFASSHVPPPLLLSSPSIFRFPSFPSEAPSATAAACSVSASASALVGALPSSSTGAGPADVLSATARHILLLQARLEMSESENELLCQEKEVRDRQGRLRRWMEEIERDAPAGPPDGSTQYNDDRELERTTSATTREPLRTYTAVRMIMIRTSRKLDSLHGSISRPTCTAPCTQVRARCMRASKLKLFKSSSPAWHGNSS